jgi:hypothetical protein
MSSHRRARLAACGSFLSFLFLATAFTTAPVGFDPAGHGLAIRTAYAKGGNGGGNGNGNGNGGSGHARSGKGSAAAESDTDTDPAIFEAPADGSLSSSLGGLNAAHASPKGLTHAAPNSRVGRIETYKEVVQAENTLADPNATPAQTQAAQAYLDSQGLGQMTPHDAEQTALGRAANKPVTDQIMDAVNDLLGL